MSENLITESIELNIFSLVDYEPIIIKLLSYLLKRSSRLSMSTINNLENGIGLFVKKFLEMYPVDLCNLFELFTGIIKGAPQSLNKVKLFLSNVKICFKYSISLGVENYE